MACEAFSSAAERRNLFMQRLIGARPARQLVENVEDLRSRPLPVAVVARNHGEDPFVLEVADAVPVGERVDGLELGRERWSPVRVPEFCRGA